MVGLQGQVSRLEIASTVVDYDKGSALLITGVEIIPTQTVQALRLGAGAQAAPRRRSCWRSIRSPRRSSPPTRTGASPS